MSVKSETREIDQVINIPINSRTYLRISINFNGLLVRVVLNSSTAYAIRLQTSVFLDLFIYLVEYIS